MAVINVGNTAANNGVIDTTAANIFAVESGINANLVLKGTGDTVYINGISTTFKAKVTGTKATGYNLTLTSADGKTVSIATDAQSAQKIVFLDGAMNFTGKKLGSTSYGSKDKVVKIKGIDRADVTAKEYFADTGAKGTFTLTSAVDGTSTDPIKANVFNALPAYTPGGNDLVNSLQDWDTLEGVGINPTLNVTLVSENDNQNYTVTPKLTNIQTVNIVQAGSADLNLGDATGVTTVNVNRITQEDTSLYVEDMDKTVTNLGYAANARNATVQFQYREDVLTSTTDTLNLTLTNSRADSVYVNTWDDEDDSLNYSVGYSSDQGYSFETVNLVSVGNNDLDDFGVESNGKEDFDAGLAADTTKQTLNITTQGAGSLEINELKATEYYEDNEGAGGFDRINIVANHRVDIAKDKFVPLNYLNDGIASYDLELLTISGSANVTIDGLDGQVGEDYDTQGLTVSAGSMTGNLRIGVEGYVSDDDLFVLTSGSGNDEVVTYGQLKGSITTQNGNDTVRIGQYDSIYNDDSEGDLEGGLIAVGEGNNTVVLLGGGDLDTRFNADSGDDASNDQNLENNSGFDDIVVSRITSGSGNDTITVDNVESAQDWDNRVLTDENLDDVYFMAGSSISSGAGNDVINLGWIDTSNPQETRVYTGEIDEGGLVDAGLGNDVVNVNISNREYEDDAILNEDTDANISSVGTGANKTQEVGLTFAADRLGAILDLGSGTDTVNFVETHSIDDEYSSAVIVGRDAEIRGAETMNVVALDSVYVTTATDMSDQDQGTNGVQTDINANVIGTQTLNLTIANQIDDDSDLVGLTENDSDDDDGYIYVDVQRFDSALQTVNLESQERVLFEDAGEEHYQAGTDVWFDLENMRTNVALTLKANEATGLTDDQPADDTLLSINASTGAVTTNEGAEDVNLDLDYSNVRGMSDSAELRVLAGSGAFDLDLELYSTTTDLAATNAAGDNGEDASLTDDDAMTVENFAIKFADTESHSIDMNGFGEASSTKSTSLNVWSAASSGKTIAVNDIQSDTIAFANGNGTAPIAANVILKVSADNAYTITTGSGNDIIDMRSDDVQADNTGTADLNEKDTITAGTGRDTLIINGDDGLGNNNIDRFSEYSPLSSTIIDDDVFAGIRGVERILVDSDFSGEDSYSDITLDEQATLTGVDTIALVGDEDQTINLAIGNNFTVATSSDNVNSQNTGAASAILIDASQHTGNTHLNIDNKDDDTDLQNVNMDIRLNAEGGATLDFVNTGSSSSVVNVTVTQADVATSIAGAELVGPAYSDEDGEVVIRSGWTPGGTFDKLIVLDNGTSDVDLDIDISSVWTSTAFEVDASGVKDLAGSGSSIITVNLADTATYTIKGTQLSDQIYASHQADTLSGNDGDDLIIGFDGIDTINGGNGNDYLVGEYIPVEENDPSTLSDDQVSAVDRVITVAFTDLDLDSDTDGGGGDTDQVTRISISNGNVTFVSGDVDNMSEVESAFESFLSAAGWGGSETTVTSSGSTVTVEFDHEHADFFSNLLANFTVSVVEEYAEDGTTIVNTVTQEGSLGYIDLGYEMDADILTGGAGNDTFFFTVSGGDNMLSTNVMDTITDLNLGGNGASSVDKLHLVESDVAGDDIGTLQITSVVSGTPVNINTYGDSLTQAINDMFSSGREFGSDETNIAALVNYGADTYLVALGSIAQDQFGFDDYIVKVTGVSGTLDAGDFITAGGL